MKHINRNLYLKYFVKSRRIFLAFLIICTILFFFCANAIKIEKVITYSGTYAENRIIVNDTINYNTNKLYAYKNRGEKITRFKVLETTYVDDFTLFYVDDDEVYDMLNGNIKIDLVYGYTTLLDVLFKVDFKYFSDIKYNQ